jgi:predicted secreted hydrolase
VRLRREVWPAALLVLVACGAAPVRDGWRLAVEPRRFTFPRDHAAHPEYRTEWWYYTGHLEAGGRRFGYQVTFFRAGLDRARERSRSAWAPHTLHFAHFALTDETRGRFRFHDVMRRPALGLAGADTARYHVWVEGSSARLLPDGRAHRVVAVAPEFSLALDLAPLKPPVLHGERGLSRKSSGWGNASHYYSLTRMATSGTLEAGAESLAVTGESWMDHEFGTSQLAEDQVGWDWFSLQLDDGRELMLYVLRRKDGGIEPLSSGTLVGAAGSWRHLERREFAIEAIGRWTSPASGARYPHGWIVRVPGEGLELEVTPTVRDQELRADASGGIVYWEGSARVRGTSRGRAVAGRGYVELTGYAGPTPGL